jgi:GDP-mannose 6-dehydrogenase
VSVNPEFLREGTAIRDFTHPPLTLVGTQPRADAAPTKALYQNIDAPLYSATIRVAEMIKYTSNTWHAVKVVFANEIGNLCKRLGRRQPRGDGHLLPGQQAQPVAVLSQARASPSAGSCLPKDVRALQYRAKELDLEMPLFASLLTSNHHQVGHAIDRIVETGRKKVGLLGFSFKADTDDLRESPMVILAEALLGKGYELCIYDRNVSMARLVGANKQYITEQIPHLSRHLCESIDQVIDRSEVIVIGNAAPEFSDAVTALPPGPDHRRSGADSSGLQQGERSVRRHLLVVRLFRFFLTWWGTYLIAALDASMMFFLPFGVDAVVIFLAARDRELAWL